LETLSQYKKILTSANANRELVSILKTAGEASASPAVNLRKDKGNLSPTNIKDIST